MSLYCDILTWTPGEKKETNTSFVSHWKYFFIRLQRSRVKGGFLVKSSSVWSKIGQVVAWHRWRGARGMCGSRQPRIYHQLYRCDLVSFVQFSARNYAHSILHGRQAPGAHALIIISRGQEVSKPQRDWSFWFMAIATFFYGSFPNVTKSGREKTQRD